MREQLLQFRHTYYPLLSERQDFLGLVRLSNGCGRVQRDPLPGGSLGRRVRICGCALIACLMAGVLQRG